MSAWREIIPKDKDYRKFKSGVVVSCPKNHIRRYIRITFYPDSWDYLDGLEAGDRFRLYVPDGDKVNRVKLTHDKNGKYEVKKQTNGNSLYLIISDFLVEHKFEKSQVEFEMLDGDPVINLPAMVTPQNMDS